MKLAWHLGLLLLACVIPATWACRREAPEQLYQSGWQAWERSDYPLAAKLAKEGFERCRHRDPHWAFRFRVLRGQVLASLRENEAALAVLQEPAPPALAGDEAAVWRLLTLAIAGLGLQRFDAAQQYLDDAAKLAAERQPQLAGEVVQARGVLAGAKGNNEEAVAFFHLALTAAQRLHQPVLQAKALLNLGWAQLRAFQYGEAITSENAARQLYEAMGNRAAVSKIDGNLGWCYFKLGDYDSALELTTEANDSARALGTESSRRVWLRNLGLISERQQDYDAASRYYRESFALADKLKDRTEASASLLYLALLEARLGRFGEAEGYNRQAMQIALEIGDREVQQYALLNQARIQAGTDQHSQAEENLRKLVSEPGEEAVLQWSAESLLGQIYAAEGRAQQAEAQYRQAIASVDTARASVDEEEHRFSFYATASDFYNDYIDFLVSQGRKRDALQVAEHSRARALQEGLGVQPQPGSFRLGNFHPEQVSAKLNAVILSYWLKPQRSYLWVVTHERVTLFPLPADIEINAAARAYREALGKRGDQADRRGEQLYRMLVAPAQNLIPLQSRVIVIADGNLHALNFEALPVAVQPTHYWIEDVTLSNAGSLALLQAAGGRHKRNGGEGLLLIGNPVSPNADFPELPQAGRELELVEKHFSGRKLVLARSRATPSAYAKSEPGRFSYIHFVAHATASRLRPLDSGVILSAENGEYKLYARDIMKQRLRADLVTISACYGAGTRAYSGEGLVGLSWAFLRAGAHQVIAALWEVNDDSTSRLMDHLYTELQAGQDPAGALRAAKLGLLHSDTYCRRPFYWAPFQLYAGR